MTFFDTSVFVAAAQRSHGRHAESLLAVVGVAKGRGCCSAYTLVELYSVLTRSPRPQRVAPLDALAMVELVRERMKMIELDEEEQYSVIRRIAKQGLMGGIVHDALIMQCAKKARASKIYTLNVKHFRLVAPEMAGLVMEP